MEQAAPTGHATLLATWNLVERTPGQRLGAQRISCRLMQPHQGLPWGGLIIQCKIPHDTSHQCFQLRLEESHLPARLRTDLLAACSQVSLDLTIHGQRVVRQHHRGSGACQHLALTQEVGRRHEQRAQTTPGTRHTWLALEFYVGTRDHRRLRRYLRFRSQHRQQGPTIHTSTE